MTVSAEHRPVSRDAWTLFGAMAVIWGVPYMFIKVAVRYVEPPVVVFGRTIIAAVLLMAVAVRRGALRPALARWRDIAAFAVIEMAIPWVLLTDAERRLPSGVTGLLIACVPIFGAVVAYLLGDRTALRPLRLVGIGLGLAGVAVLVAGDLNGSTPVWSVIEVLVVCVGYASAPFMLTRRLADVPDIGIIALSLAIVAMIYAPIAALTWPTMTVPARAWWSVIALGVICTMIAFLVFFRLVAAVGPARATLITFLNPAVAVVVGAIFLDERITVATLIGFVLVTAGCWFATRHHGPHRSTADAA